MAFYDLYGIEAGSLDDARVLVAELIPLSFEERSSDYHDGVYFVSGDDAGEHFVLKRNRDPFEDVPAEEAFPDSGILFYVNKTTRSDDVKAALARAGGTVVMLRHEHL